MNTITKQLLIALLLCIPLWSSAAVCQQPTTSINGMATAPQASYSSTIQPAGQLQSPLSVRRSTSHSNAYKAVSPSASYTSPAFGSTSYGASPLRKKSNAPSAMSGAAGMSGGSTLSGGTRSGSSNTQFTSAGPTFYGGSSITFMSIDDDDEPPTSNSGHSGDEPIIVPLGDFPLLLLLLLSFCFCITGIHRKNTNATIH